MSTYGFRAGLLAELLAGSREPGAGNTKGRPLAPGAPLYCVVSRRWSQASRYRGGQGRGHSSRIAAAGPVFPAQAIAVHVLVPPPGPSQQTDLLIEHSRRQQGERHFVGRTKAPPPNAIDGHENHGARPIRLHDQVDRGRPVSPGRRRGLADPHQRHLAMTGYRGLAHQPNTPRFVANASLVGRRQAVQANGLPSSPGKASREGQTRRPNGHWRRHNQRPGRFAAASTRIG